MLENNSGVKINDTILITGASGFIGSHLVSFLHEIGFTKLRCLVRPNGRPTDLISGGGIEIVYGNLLSPRDCIEITRGASYIYHLAAGTGQKSYAAAYLNSVVTSKNLLSAAAGHGCLRRFVNVSSVAVYTTEKLVPHATLDETCPMDSEPQLRGDAYTYAKVHQDRYVSRYCLEHDIPLVIVRPGAVFGPGKNAITGRVGISTFGIFLHLGGSNRLPLTYVSNCAEAIGLAGLKEGIEGHIFNIVDDNAPSSRRFLRLFKKKAYRFRSISVPRPMWYAFCCIWERYSRYSHGQLPAVFNRKRFASDWKGIVYSNAKAKNVLMWTPRVGMSQALDRYFDFMKSARRENA